MAEGIEQVVFLESILEQKEALSEIMTGYERRPENLIPLLQNFQGALGYLPEAVLLDISNYIRVPPAKTFAVATFYAQFRLHPVGEHIIRVCRGTACHVRRSSRILREIQSRLHIMPGETTKDRLFTLETVACFGSCALAPVMVVDETVFGRMNPTKAMTILDQYGEVARHRIKNVG